MNEFGPETFGELYAAGYDEVEASPRLERETRESVDLLAELAGGGKVLELAIGTGRVALPLAAKGLTVHGIEGSAKMVEQMRAKPGGEAIPVVVGDMADVPLSGAVDGDYRLMYLVFNTIFNLTTQEAQVRLFRNVAKCLAPGGVFLVETFVPDVTEFRDGQSVRGRFAAFDAAGLEIRIHDPVAQTIHYQRIRFTEQGTRLAPLVMRYAWPSELDLMAQLAGLELRDRRSGWNGEPFTARSERHVSVWGRAHPERAPG